MFKLYLEPEDKEVRQFHVYNRDDCMVFATRQRSFYIMWLDNYETYLAGKYPSHPFNNKRYYKELEFLGEYESREELVNAIEMFSLLEDAPLVD